jgi:2-polyprenyl-3-methyl-5-hydroxy-6-metoxy-1,4-benzoquinol methylase
MTRWTRTRDLALPLGGEGAEVWELRDDGGGVVASYPLDVRLGKPFNVIGMKGQSRTHLHGWASQVRDSVVALYRADAPHRCLAACPCCGGDLAASRQFACVHGIDYRRCGSCAHVFVAKQPAPQILNRMFAENDAYSQEYTSREQIDQRLGEIVQPKLDWVRSVYQRHFGREPGRVLDIGAGGGHFVACCRRSGLEAEGYEINKAAIAFARAVFDVELTPEDFVAATAEAAPCDLVTLWGLLEYTPEPARFVAAARRRLGTDRGMLVVEVPRADALCSAIQSQCRDIVWRHLSPASHVNVYSDASIATLLHDNGFKPVAAWYFGMDFYELLCQFAVSLEEDRVLTQLGALIAPMQAWLDAAEFVDDLVIAAVRV